MRVNKEYSESGKRNHRSSLRSSYNEH